MKYTRYMKRFFFFFLFLPLIVNAQITDSFSDGDFTNNPQWYGNIDKFEIINPPTSGDGSLNTSANNDGSVLRSKPSMGDAILLTNSNQAYGEWRFSIADCYGWAVSSTNDYKIILMTDDSLSSKLLDGTHNFNGYFLQFDGGASDKFILYKQTGTTSTEIINTGYPATDDATTAEGKTFKIIRTPTGDWSIYADLGFNINPSTQRGITVNDNTHTSSSFFGMVTNITNPGTVRLLYFDNLYIGPVIVDTEKPYLSTFEVISGNQIDLTFNESITITSAENPANYSLSNLFIHPQTASLDANDNKTVRLQFQSSFPLGIQDTLSIAAISDLNNNLISDTSIFFNYYTVQPHDIVINEIMTDPTPVVDLPEYEYIELYNRSPFSIDLNNWTITIGSTSKVIPTITMPADSYLVLCSTTAAPFLQNYGNALGVASFPVLTNSGQNIILKSETGLVVSTVTYSDTWYQDAIKKDGGWSLEKIDPNNFCSQAANWKASTNISGGSPSTQNAVFGLYTDFNSPEITSLEVISANQINLIFNEDLDPSIALLPTNYLVNNNIGNPTSIIINSSDSKILTLNFATSFAEELENTIIIQNIADICGNVAANDTLKFTHYIVKQFDIVINEIMADPDPSVQLPNFEYIELYNRSNFDISLKDWKISAGTTIKTISAGLVPAKGFAIITDVESLSAFQLFGNTIGVESFPSLTNTGENICLKDKSGSIISSVNYSDTWYKNNIKINGGWSLEQIDPNTPCAEFNNWIASNDQKGGSPGQQNSVFASNPDTIVPELVRAAIIDNSTIQLYFSESLDSTTVLSTSIYVVNHNIGNPSVINPVEPDYKSLILSFSQNFNIDTVYTVTINSTLTDCVGNIITSSNSCQFAIPQPVDSFDIAINEVLFNPLPDNVDFVEIYNRSNKTIDLKDIRIANCDDLGQLNSISEIAPNGFLLFPKQYLVLTSSDQKVKEKYKTINQNGFVNILGMPSFNDDEGTIVICDKSLNMIDKFKYTDKMQFELLNSVDGVSLERINFNYPTNDQGNWHSAAESVGFATPAYKNSQYSENIQTTDDIKVSPEVFSPDNDGYNDVLQISYSLKSSGFVANIDIYDSNGRLEKHLVKSQQLAMEGVFTWDGINELNQKGEIGIYVIYIELFDLKGDMKKYKKTCVLANKLN